MKGKSTPRWILLCLQLENTASLCLCVCLHAIAKNRKIGYLGKGH